MRVLLCCLGAIKPKWFVFLCVLPLCQVALAAYGGGGAGPTLPRFSSVTLHAHHMPDIPSIASSSMSKQSANIHELLDMGCCASAKGLPLSAPWWVLKAFVCVGCARSKPIVTRVSRYGANYGARYGAHYGRATGRVWDSHLP